MAAIYYLGQNPDMVERRIALESRGTLTISAYAQATAAALQNGQTCYAPPDKGEENRTHVGGLSRTVGNATNAVNEALQLAFRIGFIVLDSSGGTAHRSYGCLYGVELYGGSNPVAVIPSRVSVASAVQKLFSAMFIFLFGPALRNMLKMK